LFKKRYLFLIFIICLFAVSAVSGAEISNETDVLSINEININDDTNVFSVDNNDENVLKANEGTFADLQKLIDESSGTLNLPYNFTYNAEIDGRFINGVVIDKKLTINGNDYTISGNNRARIFQITASNVKLTNTTFINGNAAGYGGAINFNGSDNCVSYCNFTDNTALYSMGAGYGGAINFNGSDNCVSHCNFNYNTADNRGGAINFNGSDNCVSYCNFTDNTASFYSSGYYGYGGAINFNGSDNCVSYCDFTGNTADNHGGAIIFSGGFNNNVSYCNFNYNTADSDGGAIKFNGYKNRVSYCNFTGNTASHYSGGYSGGGAIKFDSSDNCVSYCNFNHNTAYGGGAIYYFYGYKNCVSYCNFTGNTASYSRSGGGGAIIFSGGFNNVSYCNFIDNKANNGGGAIYFIDSDNCVSYCDFTGNTADNHGGAIIFSGGFNNNVSYCNFNYNTADGGGAIKFNGYKYCVSYCNFIDNKANDYGGAINFIGSDNCVSYCNFIDNKANNGGAISCSGESNKVNYCTFVNDTAHTCSEINVKLFSDLNYNWWGSNNPDWNTIINNNYMPSNYAVLNVSANPSEIYNDEKSDIVTKFVWNGTTTDATILLPKRSIKLETNGTLTETEGDVGLISQFSATAEGVYYVNAAVDNEILGGNIVVNPKSKENLTISASSEPIIVGENANVIVTGLKDATGEVIVTIGSNKCTGKINKGTANIVITGLKESVIANVNYPGDNWYNPASTTVKITVNPNVIINAPDVTKYYGGPERFIVTLKDLNGNPIKNAVVKITINGRPSNRTTDDNGIASMGINLNSGVYITTTEYNGTKVNSTVTVKDTVIAKDFSKIFRNGTQYQGTFVDSQGNLIRNTDIEININGVFYTRKTNDNGIAKMNINLPPGTYILTATNPLSKEQHTTKVTVLPSIVENYDLTKYYKNSSKYTLRIIGDDGKPVGEGVTVKLNINGVFYERKTNATGYMNMNINLPPGTYTVTAEYNGLRASNKITVLSVLETKDLVMKYRDGSKFEAKILDGQGRPYAGQTVTFNINGVFYTKTTEADGIARLKINLLAGEYIITSMYNGLNAANKVIINNLKSPEEQYKDLLGPHGANGYVYYPDGTYEHFVNDIVVDGTHYVDKSY